MRKGNNRNQTSRITSGRFYKVKDNVTATTVADGEKTTDINVRRAAFVGMGRVCLFYVTDFNSHLGGRHLAFEAQLG